MQTSPAMDEYYRNLESGLQQAIDVARKARSLGLDPEEDVEISLAEDLASRVEALLGYKGLAARIRELESEYSREEIALRLGDDFAQKRFGETTREEILDHAIRAAMALLTEGVVAAPTEGIARVSIGINDDGTDYLKIYYAGPIRSAGGTAQALSVLVGDYVRRLLGIGRYQPRPAEVERYIEEIRMYNSIMSLQYLPSDDEIRTIVRNCPVCIDGEGTEKQEVGGYRNLERVETNAVRGGMALVIAEGLALKAPKIQKIVSRLNLEGWEWIDDIIGTTPSAGDDSDSGAVIRPKERYLNDLIGGRPVFAYPMRPGGFRLRLGRARNTGFAAVGLNPATMEVLGGFLAVGTQLKTERPGKAAGVVPVDSIDGPTVRLTGGDVLRIDDLETLSSLEDEIDCILDVGEILISFGEFLENNHPLVPPAYGEEWWCQESGCRPPADELEALEFAAAGAPLHPAYTWLWDDLTVDQVRRLADFVVENGTIREGRLCIPLDEGIKQILETILIPHRVRDGRVEIEQYLAFLACLGLTLNLTRRETWEDVPLTDPLTMVQHLSGFTIRSRAGTRIGARMGRPGKSKPRQMSPPPHLLFPVGDAGGSRRSFQEATAGKPRSNTDGGIVELEMGIRQCPSCGARTYLNRCECGTHTHIVYRCPRCKLLTPGPVCPACGREAVSSTRYTVDMKEAFARALDHLGMRKEEVAMVKGVKGLISRNRSVEPIEKGILRSSKNLHVFKDGTIRYDIIDLPVTHVRPAEIGVSLDRLHELGYTHDIHGKPLTAEDQVFELRPQDILVSEDCAKYLVQVAGFIDEMLERLYGMEPFYNVREPADLVGHLLIGLAPHTSAGVLARLVGFTEAAVGYAHPFFHAAKRRNCFERCTAITVTDGREWRTLPIWKFVVENFDISDPQIDRLGTYYSDPIRPYFTPSIDPYGNVSLKRITSVSIHRAPPAFIRFETGRGRSLTVTPDHTMLVWDTDYLRRVRAIEVKEGDAVPVYEGGRLITDRVKVREIVETADDRVYSLTVEENHTVAANGIFTGQCDGDEDCVMLLLDGLINFSRSFLPETRGGTMDAPLVLTTRIDPAEIDKESHNLDVCDHYPLEVYEGALRYAHPKEFEKIVERVESRLGTPAQLEGFLYTHETTDISAGPLVSTYTSLGTMLEKLECELELAKKIRAVDEDDVAERVLNTHFIRDMMGNLNAFSRQKVRCTRCNAKFRRVPISGRCPRCGGNIIPTVHEGSVKKYLDVSRRICAGYRVSEYTRQRVDVLALAIESTFGQPSHKQMGLADFL
ncbi:MAG: DNA-directed DNA polymerase II large subunit [Methanoculleaceae archaeon]